MNFEIMRFLFVSMLLFLMGILGIFLVKKNIMMMLMSMELMLLAVNLNFMMFSVYLNDMMGQAFGLFIMTVAAAESAMGLAMLVVYYRMKGMISMNFMNSMKG